MCIKFIDCLQPTPSPTFLLQYWIDSFPFSHSPLPHPLTTCYSHLCYVCSCNCFCLNLLNHIFPSQFVPEVDNSEPTKEGFQFTATGTSDPTNTRSENIYSSSPMSSTSSAIITVTSVWQQEINNTFLIQITNQTLCIYLSPRHESLNMDILGHFWTDGRTNER